MAEDGSRRELARGTVELAVLALIGKQPRYGYELLTSLSEVSSGAPEVKEGTLYPLLHRLEDGGFIHASWVAEGRAAPRKYYDLTDSGADRLSRLQADWQQLVDGMTQILKECT